MNWEEACRGSVTVKELAQQQEALVARGGTLVGSVVKVQGFLLLLDDSPPDAFYGDDPKKCVFLMVLADVNSDNHHLMHNLFRKAKYEPEYVISVENDRYLFLRLADALPCEVFLEESHLWAAVPAVITGIVVPASHTDFPFGIQPISTTSREPYAKDREHTVTF